MICLDFGEVLQTNMENEKDCQGCQCLNSGYTLLEESGASIEFETSGYPNPGYDNRDYCYWGIYAPNATSIEVNIEEGSVRAKESGKKPVSQVFSRSPEMWRMESLLTESTCMLA